MPPRLARARRALPAAAALLVGCHDPTGALPDVAFHRALWTAHGITSYEHPTQIDIDGPPDASGTVRASRLVPLR